MPFYSLNGCNIHVEIAEHVAAHDTIFLHGNLASNAWWEPVRELYQRRADGVSGPDKASLYFMEWRGCGKSAGLREEGDLNLKQLASDVVALAKTLKKPHLVGHSTGGLIALYAMAEAPEVFGKALLLDSVAATGIAFGPEMYDAFTQMSQNKEICAAVILGTIHEAEISDALKVKIVNDAFGVHPLIWHGVPNMLKGIDFRPELKKIPNPVLVLHGEKDLLLPIEGSKELAALLPQAKFEEIPARGHSTNVENPALFQSYLDRFLFG